MIETPSIDSIERVASVADILPYYFLLANTAGLLIEGPLQLYSTQHNTAQHKAIIPTPNPTTANWLVASTQTMAASQVRSAATEIFCSDTLVARLSSLSCLDVLLQEDFAFLDNMYSCTVRTAMAHLRPPARKPTYISSIEDESGSRASPAVLL